MGRTTFKGQWLRAACAALVLAVSLGSVAAQRRTTYTNPVIAGDFPDPSVIRVGHDYWAAATSSEWAPEFPLLHSRDLVNWQVVGAVFQKRPAWAVGNFWAPEISEHQGRFFVYYAAHKKDGPLCVAVATASRPQGPYTDHGPLVCQEVGSIDAFPATDEKGERYLLWKEDGNSVSKPTPIWAQALSADGTRLVGERHELFHNDQAWEKHASLPYGNLVEGPAMVRHNGWFYIFYSGNFCCARECNYMMGVARARHLLGPWEKNPGNPILRGNETWKCPGHGTIVTDPKGRDFLLYHAYRASDFVYVGRQALLDEIKWGADGWPQINEGRGPSVQAASPFGSPDRQAQYSFFDDFTNGQLMPGWQWPQGNEPDIKIESRNKGQVILAASGANQSKVETVSAVLARSTTTGDYVATTRVNTQEMAPGAVAGLAAYGDQENALGVSVIANRVRLWRLEKGQMQAVTETNAPNQGRMFLRMTTHDGHLYSFDFSLDNRQWTEAGRELDGQYLPPWDRGVRVALIAGSKAPAYFDWLRITASR